jgi:hypothetical protein
MRHFEIINQQLTVLEAENNTRKLVLSEFEHALSVNVENQASQAIYEQISNQEHVDHQ